MESAWKVTYLDKPETGLVAVSVSRRFAVRTDAGDADANAGASNNHAPSEKATPASGSPSLTQADGTTLAPMAEKYSFDSSRIRGVSFPPWLRETRWEDLTKKVQLRPSDILVATYPKSGTTLMEQAILAFLSGATDPYLFRAADKNALGRRTIDSTSNLTFAKVWPEACLGWAPGEDTGETKRGAEFAPLSYEAFDALPTPRLLKTHAPAHMVPGALPPSLPKQEGEGSQSSSSSSCAASPALALSGAKFVVVVRSPKDVCTSAYYHAWSPAKSGWPFEAWATAWLAGATPSGSWVNWHAGWRQALESLGGENGEGLEGDDDGRSSSNTHHPRGLMLTYEAMTSSDETVRLDTFRQLGRFVLPARSSSVKHGNDGREDNEEKEAEFEALVRRVDKLCQFDAMKAQALATLKTTAPAPIAPTTAPAVAETAVAAAANETSLTASSGNSGTGSHHRSNLGVGHMRHGKAGNWAEHFTPAQAAHFDAQCNEEAQRCGLV